MIEREPRRPLSTATIVVVCVVLVLAASELVDVARMLGSWPGAVAWVVGGLGLGWLCGWLAERITGD